MNLFKNILFLLGPMLIVTNTELTYSDTSIREDLSDVIYDISPSETPIFSSIGKGKAEQPFFEWQIDQLEPPVSTNAQIEGDDVTAFDAVTRPDRLGNRQQISRKTVIVGATTEASTHAGIESVEGRALARKMKELKLDIEKTLQENQASTAGNSTTARTTGALLAFIKTNTDVGATGTDPVYTSEPTDPRNDGTPRAFTDTILKSVLSQMYTAGANIDACTLYLGAFNKAAFSAFSSTVSRQLTTSKPAKAAIVAAADVYVGEFGTIKVVPNRWGRARDGLLLDPSFAAIDYLRPFKRVELAKTGDAKKSMLIVEWGLRVNNEAAHGLAADLTTS
jgi:hypothetical protein